MPKIKIKIKVHNTKFYEMFHHKMPGNAIVDKEKTARWTVLVSKKVWFIMLP